jgi:hypothetical protein
MALPGKGRFPPPKRCFPGEKRGFPSEKRYKTISSRDKTRFIKLGGWSKTMFSRRMSHNRQPPQKYAKNILCPGLNPLAQGQFPLKRRDTRHLASRGISAFRSGINVPGLFCVVRGRITRFSRFCGLGSAYDHGQKEVYSASFPEPLLQMQAGHPIYCGRRQNEVYPGCEVDSKGGGQRLKEQGFIRWGVTDPLQPARKTRFIRLWPLVWPRKADSRAAKAHVPQAVGR